VLVLVHVLVLVEFHPANRSRTGSEELSPGPHAGRPRSRRCASTPSAAATARMPPARQLGVAYLGLPSANA